MSDDSQSHWLISSPFGEGERLRSWTKRVSKKDGKFKTEHRSTLQLLTYIVVDMLSKIESAHNS